MCARGGTCISAKSIEIFTALYSKGMQSFALGRCSFEHLETWLGGVYNLELQREGVADTWITLHGEIEVTQASDNSPLVIASGR